MVEDSRTRGLGTSGSGRQGTLVSGKGFYCQEVTPSRAGGCLLTGHGCLLTGHGCLLTGHGCLLMGHVLERVPQETTKKIKQDGKTKADLDSELKGLHFHL